MNESGYTKITVSVPTEDVQRAKAIVAHGGAKSVSKLVSDALHDKLSRERDLALLAAMTGGEPIPADALAWAAQALGVPHLASALIVDEETGRPTPADPVGRDLSTSERPEVRGMLAS